MSGSGRERVAVLMSGGVDSSVAAALLSARGYDVVGMTLQLWDYEAAGSRPANQRGCCDISHQLDARHVCDQLGVPHVVVDLRDRFQRDVVEPYEETYLRGQTPNPCVVCNSRLKWDAALQKVDALECRWIATGHYARIEHDGDRARLRTGVDPGKDQSYALWQVAPAALARTLLPLGGYTKEEIRREARRLGLRTAEKSESQEVCFIPDHYADHLRQKRPGLTSRVGRGRIVDRQGRVRGSHHGFFAFTVGQRRGLNIADGQGPYYVTELDPDRNRVVVGSQRDLLRPGLLARQVSWLSADRPGGRERVWIRIRYNDRGAAGWVVPDEQGARLVFDEPRGAVSPGQSVVWYRGDEVLGGGLIARAMKEDEARQALEKPTSGREAV